MPNSHIAGVNHVRFFAAPPIWPATVAFYAETLGLPLIDRNDDAGWAIFAFGVGPTLGIERADPAPGEDVESMAGRFTGVSFTVGDIHAAHRDLSARGVVFVGPPQLEPWGGWLGHFTDPAGNVVTLVQPPAGG